MSDMRKDPFSEYIHHVEPSRKALGYAWYTAIGLQAVDGLQTSEYLRQTAQDNIEGKITLSEANRRIESYYRESAEQGEDRTQESFCVMLCMLPSPLPNGGGDVFSPVPGIHRTAGAA